MPLDVRLIGARMVAAKRHRTGLLHARLLHRAGLLGLPGLLYTQRIPPSRLIAAKRHGPGLLHARLLHRAGLLHRARLLRHIHLPRLLHAR